MSVKIKRIASNMMKEISYILANEIKDEHIKFVSVTDCKVTNDLSFAKVYINALDENKKEEILHSLDKAKGFIRKMLSERIDIRHIPELQFVYDDSLENGQKIENIINKIHENEN